jgi:hypothetical protein
MEKKLGDDNILIGNHFGRLKRPIPYEEFKNLQSRNS